MYVRRERRYTVRMGEYESHVFGAEVGVSHLDLGYTDADLASLDNEELATVRLRLERLVADSLDAQLEEEVFEAAGLTTDRNSFIIPIAESYRKGTSDGRA